MDEELTQQTKLASPESSHKGSDLVVSSIASICEHARQFAEPLLVGIKQSSGEETLSHADAVVLQLAQIGASAEMQAAVYLAHGSGSLNRPRETLLANFDESLVELALSTHRLYQLQLSTKASGEKHQTSVMHIEKVRRMLLAFSKDLRVIMLLLISQLQSLRYAASRGTNNFSHLAKEVLQIYSPLANRLGIWQIKWELEDLAFRLLEPQVYKEVATLLERKRADREQEIDIAISELRQWLSAHGIAANVQGRPKNIYSIVKKMRGKSLNFDEILDLRAMRVIVNSVEDCYRCLALIHQQMQLIDNEFDDYIAKPKSNGYQSLHTVVKSSQGKVFEIQIRTQSMHEHAEYGVAAHWAYKEAGLKGYAGVSVPTAQAERIAVLRQLIAWKQELSSDSSVHDTSNPQGSNDKIYVMTPDAAVVELPLGATPIDFAYSLHTELGHRCRGARLDGTLVPLSTKLHNGQTVEIISAKDGGPSRDWLNADLGFLASQRSKAKVRAWFNAQQSTQTIARGRELIEKLLQREGKTAYKLDDLAKKLGFDSAVHLFEVVGKDEYSLKNIELLLRPVPLAAPEDDTIFKKTLPVQRNSQQGNVLVVGMDSLLTQLAKCCRPAPPDTIAGYVTKGKGVSVHRSKCGNFLQLLGQHPDRVISVEWHATTTGNHTEKYLVDIQVLADDRHGLLRDISEVFAREKVNVVGVKSQTIKETARMIFTVEVGSSSVLFKLLAILNSVRGVQSAIRH